ncbi:MAG TPA: fimbria/pilus outer membrane usher protein [Rectinema sp.]|nr:fimbria/pilus outer membrane usher protein [Rectinema sp.]
MLKKKNVYVLVWILFLWLPPIDAQIPQTPIVHDSIVPELEIQFSISINGKPIGDIETGIWHNEPILNKEIASRLLINYLRPDIYSVIFDTLFKELDWLTANDFSLAGISFLFNELQLSLSIVIPPEYSPVVDIDFVPEQILNYKPILRPEPFAGYIQNESDLHVSDISEGKVLFSTRLNSMIDVKGVHLFSDNFFSYAFGPSQVFSWNMNSVYLLWDNTAIHSRTKIGKISIPAVSNQSQPSLYAMSLESFEDRQYMVRTGYIDNQTEFTIHKTARVSVEANGRLIRQVILEPGNYRILDLPFTTGLNEFVLRIEEIDGNVQVFRRIIPREASIMQPGTSKYALSAGTSRTDFSEFIASGYYLYGFLSTLSGGINFQVDKRSAMGGLTFSTALPIGTLNGSGSIVGRWDGWGPVISPAATLSYLFSMPSKIYLPIFGISATFRGEGFLSPNISSPSGTVPSAFLSFSTNFYTKIFANIGIGLSYSLYYTYSSPAKMTHEVFASISTAIAAGGNLGLSGRLSFAESSAPTFSLNLSFTIMPKDDTTRVLNFMQSSGGQTNISINDKLYMLGRVFDTNFGASDLLPGASKDGSMSLGIRNSSEYFDVSANGTFNYSPSSESYSLGGYTQFRSSMAFAGTHVAFLRQIPDSFLLITASPELKDKDIIYRVSNGSQYQAAGGKNIVVPIQSYETTILSIDLRATELNVAPRYSFITLSPAFRSGILFESDVIKRYIINGRLINQEGKPISYLPGDVFDFGGSLVTSTFTDELGEFEIYDILPGSYQIQWPEGFGTTQFELPDTDEDRIDLGDIKLHIESK